MALAELHLVCHGYVARERLMLHTECIFDQYFALKTHQQNLLLSFFLGYHFSTQGLHNSSTDDPVLLQTGEELMSIL